MPFHINSLRATRILGAIAVVATAVGLMGQYGGAPAWWEAGSNERMPFSSVFQNKTGDLLVYNAAGETTAGTHPFFTPMGTNGRGCITCHQLSNAMSVSPDRLQDRWVATTGRDAVFEAIDGSNCPDLPQRDRASHSLLLHRGVFRIYQQWPAVGVKPEFSIEVVRDPTGCNTSAKYGLQSTHTISVYRRPRITGNLKYLTAGNAFTADSRATTLEEQAMDALRKHEQGTTISNEDLKQIVDFEREIYVAQGRDDNAGDVSSFGAPSLLGTWNLARAKVDAPSDGHMLPIANWAGSSTSPNAGFQRSIERGSAIFNTRTFPITETANLHHGTGKAPVEGTCATCHSERMTGANIQQAWMDIGTTSLPWAGDQRDLPLFKITCSASATPHPYLGRVIYTNDPGRALVTGKCADVGSLVMQQLRGLTARAPYFTGGSAKDLRAVVDFYDKRFTAHYTEQEKQDLVNFMSVL